MGERLRALGRRLPSSPPALVGAAIAVVLTVGTAGAAVPVLTAGHEAAPHPTPRASVSALPSAVPTATHDTRGNVLPAGVVAGSPTSTSSPAAASASVAPTVAPLKHVVEADAYVTLPRQLTPKQLSAVRQVSGVKSLEAVDTGVVAIAGHKADVIGVDPSTFRAWTPKLSAKSDPLWRSVARGELAVSFDMGKDAQLPLGHKVQVSADHHNRPMRIGAFASNGLPTVDAVVSRAQARSMHFQPGGGLLVSAPDADPVKLRDTLRQVLPDGSGVQLLHKVVVVRDAGEFLTREQIDTVLKAAATQVGKPYIWGAFGMAGFDCSGLTGYAFAQAGVFLPRTSQQQWFAGPHVSLADARPGDLLFWAYDPTDPGNIDHVAIYAGDGKMIVAPHTGTNVQIRSVPTAHLAGVVRVDPKEAAKVGGPRFVNDNGTLAVR